MTTIEGYLKITCWCDCKHDIMSLDIIMLVWIFFHGVG